MTRLPLRIELEAAEELRQAVAWYRAQSQDAVTNLQREAKAALERIRRNPEMYELGSHGTRRFLLKRFPFSIIYMVRADHIRIVAFAHAKRRPNYWYKRMK